MLRQVKRVSKFWREYAGSKPIQVIGDQDLKQFVSWRRDYYATRPIPKNGKRHPTDKTIQWEVTEGKAIIRWAHEQGLRGSQPLPSYTFTPKKCGVRPPFEEGDFKRLSRALSERVKTAPDKRCRKSRLLLGMYVLLLAHTGMRVGEANNLKIRSVEKFSDRGEWYYRLNVKGKTGERDVIMRAKLNDVVTSFLNKRLEAGAKPDDLLFRMSNGQKISTLADQFDALLKEAGLTHNSQGEKHTLYSLRHYYAIAALKRGVHVFEVARNLGTSIEMIQKHYARKATARDFVRTLAA
jgi:integrase